MLYAKDINLTAGVVLTLVLALFYTTSELINIKLQIPVLREIQEFFQGMKPQATAGIWKVLSVIPAIYISLYCLPWSWLNGRHQFSSRVIEKRSTGRRSSQMQTSGLTVAGEWPDLLEFVVGLGAGSVVVSERASGKVVKRIDNIIGLFFIYPFIEKLFVSTATRNDEAELDHSAIEELS
jgi:hypothetical protein